MLHLVSLSRKNGGKLIYFSFFIITALLLSCISASGDDKDVTASVTVHTPPPTSAPGMFISSSLLGGG